MTSARTPRPGEVTGFVVGKFLPTHLGHVHLLRQAMARCDHLDVFAVWRPEEPIPGHLRARWLREEVPGAVVHDVLDELGPDDPVGWAANVRQVLGRSPHVVFTSEGYGDRFAVELGARHESIDVGRTAVPVSGTQVRHDPYACWHLLPSGARAWFAVRVAVVGAESTGTTTLAQALARHFDTTWVPEYGREYSVQKQAVNDNVWRSAEFTHVATEQAHREDAAACEANRLLICDTNAFATTIWHRRYVGHKSGEVAAIAKKGHCDLYLLTGDEIPFVQDGLRDGEHLRHEMHRWFEEALAAQTVPWHLLRGTPDQRLRQAAELIEALFKDSTWKPSHMPTLAKPSYP